jgi:Ca2+-binding RTX toxin-like protein
MQGGGAGADRLFGEDGDDVLFGDNDSDQLVGGEGLDLLVGGAGDDAVQGGAGNDTLFSGAGNDTLSGGQGNDVLESGTGSDELSGGSGEDDFIIDGNEGPATGFNRKFITDFQIGSDDLVLRNVAALDFDSLPISTVDILGVPTTIIDVANVFGGSSVITLSGTSGLTAEDVEFA